MHGARRLEGGTGEEKKHTHCVPFMSSLTNVQRGFAKAQLCRTELLDRFQNGPQDDLNSLEPVGAGLQTVLDLMLVDAHDVTVVSRLAISVTSQDFSLQI